MKIFLVVLASIGIALLLLGAVLAWASTLAYLQAPESAWSQAGLFFEWSGLGFLGGFAVGLFGTIFALIGGLNARSRIIAGLLIVSGTMYCIPYILGAVYPIYKEKAYPLVHPDASYRDLVWLLLYLLPGIIYIVEGLFVRLSTRRSGRIA